MQMMGRRTFGKMIATMWLGAVMMVSMAAKGCNAIADIQAWLPVGLQAIQNLLNLLGSFGVIPVGTGTAAAALLSKITEIFDDVKTDIALWNATPTNSTLQKIQAELQSISMQLSNFVATLVIPDNKVVQIVAGLLGLVLSTIAGFIAEIAQKMGTSASTANAQVRTKVMMRHQASAVIVEPVHRNADQFKKAYNQQLDAAGLSKFDIQ